MAVEQIVSAKKRAEKAPPILGVEGERPSYKTLQRLIEVLESDRGVEREDRKQIIDALDYLYVSFLAEDRAHKKGPSGTTTQFLALLAIHLYEFHGAPSKKAAVHAATASADRKIVQAVGRKYRSIMAACNGDIAALQGAGSFTELLIQQCKNRFPKSGKKR